MVMDIASYVKSMVKTDAVNIDNFVFRLHYRVTVAILISASLVGVAKQYFGDPINCQTSSGVESRVLDDYCWIHSTFHIRSEFQGYVGCLVDPELIQDKHVYSGGRNLYYSHDSPTHVSHVSQQVNVGHETLTTRTPDTSFYQWVPFVLVLQAALFYIPRRIWKNSEGGLMATFGKTGVDSLLNRRDQEPEDSGVVEDGVRKQSMYFINTLHHNSGYYLTFVFCEFLNMLIIIGNIYLTDFFLEGRFMKYGTQVISYLSHDSMSRLDKPNPLCTVFPTVTSCTFHSVGTGAGEQKFNSLCILSLNIVNEKVYLILWFWFFSLLLLSGLQLLARLATMAIPPLRLGLIIFKSRSYKSHETAALRNVLQHCKCSDWFVLQQMFSNCHHYNSRQIINYLNKYFSSQSRFKTRSYPKFSDENSKKRKEFYDQEEDIYARPPV